VRADADLWGLKLLYQTADARFSASRAFRRANAGRRNPQRAWLVSRLCAIWIWDFGGHLSVTTPPLGGPPRGALIDFLLAAMSQVIPGHDLPSPDTLRDQIKRERKDRENARQLGLFLDRFFKQRQ
jgi:hypothetical protein